jgi:restriction endonuclease S subunit
MGGRLLASGAWAVINPKPKILSAAYLCWQLNHPSLIERLKSTQIGSAMPFLKIASIRDLMVTVPSLETQNSISKIVDLIETTSALETKRTQLLRTMLSSILTTQNPRRGARGVKPNPNGDTSL